jgi:hypothetical protein
MRGRAIGIANSKVLIGQSYGTLPVACIPKIHAILNRVRHGVTADQAPDSMTAL